MDIENESQSEGLAILGEEEAATIRNIHHALEIC